MTDFASNFLLQARERDNDFTGAIIFFLIWGAIAVFSQYGKWKERNRKQQQSSTPAPPPIPSVIQRIIASEAQQRPPQRRPENPLRVQPRPPQARGPLPQPPKRQQKTPRRPIPPAVLSVQTKRPPQSITREDSSPVENEIGSISEKTRYKQGVSGRELRQAARPTSLRKHLLMMELLMPPVGLRSENEQS